MAEAKILVAQARADENKATIMLAEWTQWKSTL
jgi:hypothetical protein